MCIIYLLIDLFLLFALVMWLRYIFLHIFGYDIIEYENWFGTIDNPIRYRFGAGTAEYLFVTVKAIFFIVKEKLLMKKSGNTSKAIYIPIALHIIILILGVYISVNYLSGCFITDLFEYVI